MFRLTGDSLPVTKKEQIRVVPALRIWQGDKRGLGALARINTYANYLDPGFQITTVDIGHPIASGFFFQLNPSFAFKSPRLEGFQFISDPTNPLPQTIWSGVDVINVYSSSSSAPNALGLTLLTGAPLQGLAIALPDAFTVMAATCQGMALGIQQTGTTLVIDSYGNTIGVGSELEIIGTYSVAPRFICYAASFLFQEMDFLDRFDWMGINFSGAPDATNPFVNQFIWNESLHLCTVFTPVRLDAPSVVADYFQSGGRLSL